MSQRSVSVDPWVILRCAKSPSFFFARSHLAAHSAPPRSQESQWGRQGLWSPTRQCLFLYPLGPRGHWVRRRRWPRPRGPHVLSLWRKSSSIGQGKRSWVCWLRSCLESCSLHLILWLLSWENKDNPHRQDQLYEAPGTACSLFNLKLHGLGLYLVAF